MAIKKGARQLVDEASAVVDCLTAEAAIELQSHDDVCIVDLRDIRERMREGFVPESVHAPRGMLEFWVDPDSPYHRKVFAEDRHFVFYCAGGWRSALAAATVLEMGLERVSHIESGFAGWVEAGGPVRKTDDGREPR